MRILLALACLLPLAHAPGHASAQPLDRPLRIGVLTDMSGSLSAQTGAGAVLATQMAVEDCLAAECAGMKIEVLSADHQNKPDLAVAIARSWFDRDGVDVIADIIQGSVQIAVQHEVAARGKVALFPSGTTRLTNEDCSPATSVVWMWDTYSQTAGIAQPLVKPGSKWFFITADYVFGKALQSEATAVIRKNGGEVIGAVTHPFNYPGDFSPFLVQAQASGADVIALANSGTDLQNSIKQAREFNVGIGRQRLVSFVLALTDTAALGLEAAQGVLVNESFYWDLDDGTRAWSRRFAARYGGRMPSSNQAGDYSSVRAYLHAVIAAGRTETASVMAKLHELPVQDDIVRHATLRPDGRLVHDTYLFRVKSPGDSKGPYDFYDLLATIPADHAFRPFSESACAALK